MGLPRINLTKSLTQGIKIYPAAICSFDDDYLTAKDKDTRCARYSIDGMHCLHIFFLLCIKLVGAILYR